MSVAFRQPPGALPSKTQAAPRGHSVSASYCAATTLINTARTMRRNAYTLFVGL
jgi:hypothetical protein